MKRGVNYAFSKEKEAGKNRQAQEKEKAQKEPA